MRATFDPKMLIDSLENIKAVMVKNKNRNPHDSAAILFPSTAEEYAIHVIRLPWLRPKNQ